jgi:hypothetical protein
LQIEGDHLPSLGKRRQKLFERGADRRKAPCSSTSGCPVPWIS